MSLVRESVIRRTLTDLTRLANQYDEGSAERRRVLEAHEQLELLLELENEDNERDYEFTGSV